MTSTRFTDDKKRLAAIREAQMRRRVYPRLVAEGRMTQAEADEGIAIMQAIADDYRPRDMFSDDAPLRSSLR